MQKMNVSLPERMSIYEGIGYSASPYTATVVRLDGRNFSRFTRNMDKPFDKRMQSMMLDITLALCVESRADIAYTQSDEISLAWFSDSTVQYFGGRASKIITSLASLATAIFSRDEKKILENKVPKNQYPCFDGRIFSLPNENEVRNYMVWRELDAIRNSVSMLGRSVFTQREMQGKCSSAVVDALLERGIHWDECSAHSKRGIYFKPVTREISGSDGGIVVRRSYVQCQKALYSDRLSLGEIE